MPERDSILILGGTGEAMALAHALAARDDLRVITSLAGRTKVPRRPPGAVRVGGFGGSSGLADYLRTEGIAAVIDATHPFATTISLNAREACAGANVPLVALDRPRWRAEAGDRWTVVADEAAAAAALPHGARALLALGSQRLGAFAERADAQFFVRVADPPDPPLKLANCTAIVGRPARAVADERALLERHRIGHMVCRNSGGSGGWAKVAAARELGLPVIMIERPEDADAAAVESVESALAWLHQVLAARRK